MFKFRDDIHIPVIVIKRKRNICDVYIPDFDITVHGHDYVSAISNAIFYASSVFYYNQDHNSQLKLTKTYADVEALVSKYPKGAFATLININEN